ncbi:MAG: UDP-2,3-diacylglucosamine diphosphatase [Alphaproteobacteria bacterium]
MNVIHMPRHYRTLWLSDIHLGTKSCRADDLLRFIQSVEFDNLYLVGDIVDCWRLKKSWYWPPSHSAFVQEVLNRAAAGANVIFVPGNHDETARDYAGLTVGDVKVMTDAIHETADGRRLLILHGDAFDGVVRYARWLYYFGDWSYRSAIVLNHWFNIARKRLGMPYWSLSAFLKHRVKNAVQFIANFEDAVVAEARHRGVDGVVCGHVHHAEMRMIDGILYCNDGDWVESCTALVEHHDGTMEIVRPLETVEVDVRALAWAS